MTQVAPAALLASALLLLAGCGHHDHDSEDQTTNNVEMPAADLPAGPPSMDAPPPAHDPDADATSAAHLSRDETATNDAADAASVAEQVRAARAAADADQQAHDASPTPTPPAQ